MSRTPFLPSIFVTVALVLTGCASEPADTPTPTETEAPAAAPTENSPDAPTEDSADLVSDRGHQFIQTGEQYTLYDIDLPVGTWEVVSMTPIDPMAEQSDFVYDADKFHYLVEVTATATSDLVEPIQFTWSGVDSEGVTVNDTVEMIPSGIIDSEDDFPGWVGPGETIRGLVLVQFPTEHGSLIVRHSGGGGPMVGDLGYELEF